MTDEKDTIGTPIGMPDIPKSLDKLTMTKSQMMVSKTFSARFLTVVLMTVAGCYMAVMKIPIDPQFSTLWGVVVTYYFGKSSTDSSGAETIGGSNGKP